MDEAKEAIDYRLGVARDELNNLQQAFPEYAEKLENNLHKVSLTRLEQQKYMDMHDQAVISTDVYEELLKDIEVSNENTAKSSELNLNLKSQGLLAHLPRFAQLDENSRKKLAKLFSLQFVIPGSLIKSAQDKCKEIYIIASGTILVGEEQVLASGAVFGDTDFSGTHLISKNIIAKDYCKLLVLKQSKYRYLSDSERELLKSE